MPGNIAPNAAGIHSTSRRCVPQTMTLPSFFAASYSFLTSGESCQAAWAGAMAIAATDSTRAASSVNVSILAERSERVINSSRIYRSALVGPLTNVATRAAARSSVANVVAGLEHPRRRGRVEAHPDRVAPGRERVELILQHAADHHDAAVALREVLLRVDRDRALPDLRLVVARMALVLLLDRKSVV